MFCPVSGFLALRLPLSSHAASMVGKGQASRLQVQLRKDRFQFPSTAASFCMPLEVLVGWTKKCSRNEREDLQTWIWPRLSSPATRAGNNGAVIAASSDHSGVVPFCSAAAGAPSLFSHPILLHSDAHSRICNSLQRKLLNCSQQGQSRLQGICLLLVVGCLAFLV